VAGSAEHPRLASLLTRATGGAAPTLAIVHPCDAHALHAADLVARLGIARPLLVGVRDRIAKAAQSAQVDLSLFEVVEPKQGSFDDPVEDARAAATRAVALARDGVVKVLMKGSLHTDVLMSAVVRGDTGLRTERRISHAFVFDAPRYPKLITIADCVVNIAPDLRAKRDILLNAVDLLRDALEIDNPKVGIVAAVETVNPQILATVDAAALVAEAKTGVFGKSVVDGPFGFDNAISAEAARTKGISSQVAGDADLLIVPDLNAGNMLYKSFVYVGGADCAGLVLGARVPIVMTSRAESLLARVASVALAMLAAQT
jgi:phosphate acetyltransferase/phosphate butyryltransferase